MNVYVMVLQHLQIGGEDEVHVEIEKSENPQTIAKSQPVTKLFVFCCNELKEYV